MRIEDTQGNVIMIGPAGRVKLNLIKETRTRNIGTFQNKIYRKYDEEQHIFRKLNAWSINYEMFKISDKVEVKTKKRTYTIDTTAIKGHILNFKDAGIERKIYIPLSLWT